MCFHLSFRLPGEILVRSFHCGPGGESVFEIVAGGPPEI